MPFPQRQFGGTGFVGLNDYLDANKGTLDAENQGIEGEAKTAGDAATSALQTADQQAKDQAAANPGQQVDTSKLAGYQPAIDAAGKAQELGRGIGSEYGLSGSGRLGKGGEGAFNSALLYGAHGSGLSSLGSYLTAQGPAAADKKLSGEALPAPTPPPAPTPTPDPLSDQIDPDKATPGDTQRTPGGGKPPPSMPYAGGFYTPTPKDPRKRRDGL